MSATISSAMRGLEKISSPAYSTLDQEGEPNSPYRSSAEDGDHLDNDGLPTPGRRRAIGRFLVSLLINLALVLVLLGMLVARHTSQGVKPRQTSLLNSPIPDFPKEIKMFKVDPLFLSLPTPESNQAWEDLHGPFQEGMGFIRLDNESAKLYPDEKAGLSVFHQLHCLGALRMFMWNLVLDTVDRGALLKSWPEDVQEPTYEQATKGLWHYAHCFDYLRQGIQCSGDVSLEFVNKNNGIAVVDGLDYPHECTNWDSLFAYAGEHR